MSDLNRASFASQKCTGGEKTEFIEIKSSRVTRRKSSCAGNKEKASEESSNTEATVCEHEQALSEDERVNVTKEALTSKWWEEPEDWDHLPPDADDGDIAEMTTRHRELCLRRDNLKKTTMAKNENKILPTDQKKEIQDGARRVELFMVEYDNLWNQQVWPSVQKMPGLSNKTTEVKEVQKTSSSMSPTSDSYKKSRSTQIKSIRPQTDVGKTKFWHPLWKKVTWHCNLVQQGWRR